MCAAVSVSLFRFENVFIRIGGGRTITKTSVLKDVASSKIPSDEHFHGIQKYCSHRHHNNNKHVQVPRMNKKNKKRHERSLFDIITINVFVFCLDKSFSVI